MDHNKPTGRPAFDENGKWRTIRTHSNAQMAECYRQIFFCFAQPMLRAATKVTSDAAEYTCETKDDYLCRTASSLDHLFARHCEFVGSLARDEVISASVTHTSSSATDESGIAAAAKERQATARSVGAKYIPMPSMLAGSIYDNSTVSRTKQEDPKAPPALVAHIPFGFVESIFKSFGTLEYFHYEPERGVGTAIFDSGIDGEVCYVTKHLTSIVVPSIASMRGELGEDRGNVDDVFGDEQKKKDAATSKKLPQLVPVVMYMEFAAFLPFFNPCLVSHAHDAAGTSRHLLRTFPVPYAEQGAKLGPQLNDEDKIESEWQIKPFEKMVTAEGEPALPFSKIWALEADPSTSERRSKAKVNVASPLDGATSENSKGSPNKASAPRLTENSTSKFVSIQRLVLEEVLAVNINNAQSQTSRPVLPASLTAMDLWVAFACRFVLWKPIFSASLLETAGVFAMPKKGDEGTINVHGGDRAAGIDGMSEDEDEIMYQKRITDANQAVLSLALRSGSTLQQVMSVLAPVALRKYTEALQSYIMQAEAPPSTSIESSASPQALVSRVKDRLAADYIQYSPSTRRGLSLRKRLHYIDGYSLASSAQSATNNDNAEKDVRTTDEPVVTNKNPTSNDNLILRRLRNFHFEELLAVHYSSMTQYRDLHKERDQKDTNSKSSVTASAVAPFGSGEANFYELARRLVEDDVLHCSMANIQYKLRGQNDGSIAYWWLELKLRKVAATWNQIIEAKNNKESMEGGSVSGIVSPPPASLPPSVWYLHTKTADFATQMGLDDPKAILFLSSSSIVQLGLNVIDNSFLLLNMSAHPDGLPARLLLQDDVTQSARDSKNKDVTENETKKKATLATGPHVHLPPAQFPDVLSLMDEYATSGSANALQTILCSPAEFFDPRSASHSLDASNVGGLGANLLAQQQKYAGPMGTLVMITEFLWGSMRLPLLAMSFVGVIAAGAVWFAGG